MIEPHMQLAIQQAHLAAARGEVPVGAVIIGPDGAVLAVAGNECEALCNPTAHAEMLAIQQASARLGQARLVDCDLVVTLEPCAMCAAAISHARLRRVYFGAYDIKGGAVDNGPQWFSQPTCLHRPEIYGGINEQENRVLLQQFFERLRK